MTTVKFSNGNILHIYDSGGYRNFTLTKANEPMIKLVGHGYVFGKNHVYRYGLNSAK